MMDWGTWITLGIGGYLAILAGVIWFEDADLRERAPDNSTLW